MKNRKKKKKTKRKNKKKKKNCDQVSTDSNTKLVSTSTN